MIQVFIGNIITEVRKCKVATDANNPNNEFQVFQNSS